MSGTSGTRRSGASRVSANISVSVGEIVVVADDSASEPTPSQSRHVHDVFEYKPTPRLRAQNIDGFTYMLPEAVKTMQQCRTCGAQREKPEPGLFDGLGAWLGQIFGSPPK